VRAVDLNHDNGKDFVFLQVGGVWGPDGNDGVEFSATNRTAAASEFDTASIPCAPIAPTEKKFESANGKIEYHIGYSVTVT
jgi:hypothetical protein